MSEAERQKYRWEITDMPKWLGSEIEEERSLIFRKLVRTVIADVGGVATHREGDKQYRGKVSGRMLNISIHPKYIFVDTWDQDDPGNEEINAHYLVHTTDKVDFCQVLVDFIRDGLKPKAERLSREDWVEKFIKYREAEASK